MFFGSNKKRKVINTKDSLHWRKGFRTINGSLKNLLLIVFGETKKFFYGICCEESFVAQPTCFHPALIYSQKYFPYVQNSAVIYLFFNQMNRKQIPLGYHGTLCIFYSNRDILDLSALSKYIPRDIWSHFWGKYKSWANRAVCRHICLWWINPCRSCLALPWDSLWLFSLKGMTKQSKLQTKSEPQSQCFQDSVACV